MRRNFRSVAAIFLLLGLAPAAGGQAPDLKARANAAQGGEKARLCLEYAYRQLADADALFNQGEVNKAQASIREVVHYSQKAADASVSSGKQMKQTEIELRKLAKRMHDIGEALA